MVGFCCPAVLLLLSAAAAFHCLLLSELYELSECKVNEWNGMYTHVIWPTWSPV